MKKFFLLLLLSCLGFSTLVFAQQEPPKNWFHLDPVRDSFPGISTQQTYRELLGKRQGRTIIVAVLDSGVDFEHEDLRDVMWINPGEIPGNGIDDDNNGYIDDIHGWNFIGGANGENVHHDTYEVTRLYVAMKPKYEGKSRSSLSKKEQAEYDQYQEYKSVIEKKQSEIGPNLALYEATYQAIEKLGNTIDKDPITLEDVKQFRSTDNVLMATANFVQQYMSQGNSFESIRDDLKGYYEYLYGQLNYGYNPDFDPRHIVGDDFSNPYERYYGNNDVRGPDAEHGTHVAGIIGATRNNGIGMDGVADNVRIMSVRTVPDGDERDKDVANAIIYAVDNGASVINMSFGKGASPEKEAVDKAVRYALKKDVVIVHAAGNDAKENDGTNNFPHDKFRKRRLFGPKYADNWIEVGALNWDGNPANFSNYSGDNVDVFAPGTAMYSTVPGSEYKDLQGTSMAAPVVAGIAATLRSYFPELTAKQVKNIIMESVVPVKEKVKKPGSDEMVHFSQLAITGGYVNMHRAVQIAQRTKGKRRKPIESAPAQPAPARAIP
ncbi:MAG TPA: S8 family peptidase [Saprospiraceae bacterium]|nr:S8 family peptidase [Saprospiraceae bacterium]HMP25184.1 S8 family peptidase [Saprospiraceae bacterium]